MSKWTTPYVVFPFGVLINNSLVILLLEIYLKSKDTKKKKKKVWHLNGARKTGHLSVKEWDLNTSNTIHKNKLKMDYKLKCKARNYKALRGKHRLYTLWPK